MPKPNKSSTLTAMKKYASEHNISVPDKIKRADLYEMLAKKGHVAAPKGKGTTARQVVAKKRGRGVTEKEKFNVARQNLKEAVTGSGSGGARSGLGAKGKQDYKAYDGTKVRFTNATGQATIRGKAVGSFKLELSDGRMIPMAKSWRPIWSLVEATQNKVNGRNKLRWLNKWGELPKGMTMRKETDTITEKERMGAGAGSGNKMAKKKVSKEEFMEARKKLQSNLNKYKK